MTAEERLDALGFELPLLPAAAGTYVSAVQTGNLLFVSGHGPFKDGSPTFIGKLGRELGVEEGRRAAELVLLNVFATLKGALGDLERVKKVVKLLVFVNSTPEFTEHPAVANGASDLLVEIFGPERGSHARSAVGVAALPFGISVEIEGVFEVA